MKSVYFFTALILCLISKSVFAQDIYLQVEGSGSGLTGGVLTKDGNTTLIQTYRDYVRVTSMQFGFSKPIAIGSSQGSPISKTTLAPLTITKGVDISSNKLMQANLSGVPLPTVEVILFKLGGQSGPPTSPYYKVELRNAFITDYAISASESCEGCPSESFSIVYEAIQITTYSQDSRGIITPNAPARYNQVRQTPTF